jgi:hypothetical protein
VSATQEFKFNGYTLRPATEADMPLAELWTAEDPAHKGVMSGEFWTQQAKGIDGYVLEDEEGKAAFFFRMEKATRVLIQFPPIDNRTNAEEMMAALQTGMDWLAMALGAMGIHEIFYDTKSEPLRRFCEKRLGFKPTPDLHSRRTPVRG